MQHFKPCIRQCMARVRGWRADENGFLSALSAIIFAISLLGMLLVANLGILPFMAMQKTSPAHSFKSATSYSTLRHDKTRAEKLAEAEQTLRAFRKRSFSAYGKFVRAMNEKDEKVKRKLLKEVQLSAREIRKIRKAAELVARERGYRPRRRHRYHKAARAMQALPALVRDARPFYMQTQRAARIRDRRRRGKQIEKIMRGRAMKRYSKALMRFSRAVGGPKRHRHRAFRRHRSR